MKPITIDLAALEQQVLRTAAEPSAIITDAEVHHALTRDPASYFQHLYDSLAAIAAGRLHVELPLKQVFSDPDGLADFRIMPCVVRGESGTTKSVKLVGTNMAQIAVPDQITVGKALVIDPIENYITHIVDACLLSSARTGLCAALAIRLLALRSDHLTVIGSGRVGYYAALYAATNCNIKHIVFADRDPARSAVAAAALNSRLPEMSCRAMPISALASTDIVVIATTSSRPVCSPPAWQAGLVISLGADIDHQSELDMAWAEVADIYVDTLDTVRFSDLKSWIAKGRLTSASITDINKLLQIGNPAASDRVRLFVSTGSALFDNLTLDYMLRNRLPRATVTK
jgi:ornithine cyclodeaminase/alanine dehydrogenase-like protein (mu-crystallin family)